MGIYCFMSAQRSMKVEIITLIFHATCNLSILNGFFFFSEALEKLWINNTDQQRTFCFCKTSYSTAKSLLCQSHQEVHANAPVLPV